MKSLGPELQAHLDDGTTTLAWCWRITRSDGTVFGFTDHDRSLAFDDTTFEPESGFAASELRSSADLSVDAQDAEGVLRSDRITETDILDGRWDNAKVEVWRVNWQAAAQRVLMRRGAIGQIRRGRLAFLAEVRSLAHVLGQTVGRTFQASCDAALGDARCGVDLEDPAYRGHGTITAIVGDRGFTAAGLDGFIGGWFALGTVEWTSGANIGRRMEVADHGASGEIVTVSLLEAPVRPMAVGDTVTPADPAKVVVAARRWLGTPYHDQASVIGVGCDCLGLARGVWREVVGPEPFPIPPYSWDWGETGPREVLAEGAQSCMIEIEPSRANPGSLLLFRMTPRALAKHVGIVTESDRFIHAYERLGVLEEPLTQTWRRRVAFAFLFPADKGQEDG